MQEIDDTEEIAELEAELIDFTRGVTWRRVMRPALERRMQDIARKLCTNDRMTLEEIRESQAVYRFVATMLEEPIKFFSRRDHD